MYKPINNFIRNCHRLAMKIEDLRDDHLFKIEVLKDVIIDSYEMIFDENYPDLPIDNTKVK
jgi:hypothetical protein